MAAEEFFSGAVTLAQQVTSRTAIRDKLEDYEQGQISLKTLADFTRDKLEDPIKRSAEITGIVRLSSKGEMVVAVGQPFPWQDVAALPPSATKPVISEPSMIDGFPYFVIAAPIMTHDNKRLGTDLVRIDARRLLGILRDGSSLGKTGDISIFLRAPLPAFLFRFGTVPPNSVQTRRERSSKTQWRPKHAPKSMLTAIMCWSQREFPNRDG
jgi:hypothetical protein